MAHQEVGRAKMTRLLGEIGDNGQVETMPRMEGNVLVALLAPKKGVPAASPPEQPADRPAGTVTPRGFAASEVIHTRGFRKCQEIVPTPR